MTILIALKSLNHIEQLKLKGFFEVGGPMEQLKKMFDTSSESCIYIDGCGTAHVSI